VHAPYWTGKAVCRTGNCVSVHFSILRQPATDEDVTVDVTVVGSCSHVRGSDDDDDREIEVDMPNRRQLTGADRHSAADVLQASGTSATELHYAKLSQLKHDEVRAGNMTACQTPTVFRQASYERRIAERLHPNVVMELDIARECWQAAIPGASVSGYIQQLGVEPFHVVFYTEEQVRLYVDACKTGSAVMHLDATGSIVTAIAGQKRALYYCLLMRDGSVPVLDIVTTRHTGDWLHSLLLMFNASVRSVARGRLVTPRQVVTDFSYALISACLAAFNGGLTLDKYLSVCCQSLTRQRTLADLQSVTYITLCMAHMMKAVSVRLHKTEKNKTVRKLALTSFAALQRSDNMDDAKALYRAVYILLNSQKDTDAVQQARARILQAITGSDSDSIDDIGDPTDADMQYIQSDVCDAKTLKEKSPFTRLFKHSISSVTLDDDDDDAVSIDNNSYSPASFTVIENLIHLYPLWSAALQNRLEQFASDVPPSRADNERPDCLTNAAVESHFRGVKHGRLRGRRRVRPYQFVSAELQYVNGKVNEKKLPKLKSRKKDVIETEEKWKGKKRTAKYSDPSTAAKLLKSVTRSRKKIRHHLTHKELADNEIQQIHSTLQQRFSNVDGLSEPGLGQCMRHRSLPRFPAAQRRFVQVLNVGDHWLCATNYFSGQLNEVYVFDSVPAATSSSTVLQVKTHVISSG